MSNAFNKHHDDATRCTRCDRAAITVRINQRSALCLPCLREFLPDKYLLLYHWTQEHPPEPAK